MFGIGWTEFILVALVLLIFVGPKHLPGMLQKFGKIVAELRSASRELRNQIDAEVRDIGTPSDIAKEVGRDLLDDLPSPYAEVSRAEEALKNEIDEVVETVRTTPHQETSDEVSAEKPEAGKETSREELGDERPVEKKEVNES